MNYSATLIESLDEETLDEAYDLGISIRADECRESLFEFFKEFWPTIVPATLIINWHIKFICNRIEAAFKLWEQGIPPGDIVINIPPGMSKSTIVSVIFPAWAWVRVPSTRFITASYSSKLSLDLAIKMRDVIKSDKFQLFYPNHIELKQDLNNKGLYENNHKGRRLSTSVGATVTGFHGDILIPDDPMNPDMADSEVERLSANNWIEQTLNNRKTNPELSFMIMIMQRLNEDDPTGRKLEFDDAYHICLPAKLTDLDNVRPRKMAMLYKDGLMDPVRLNEAALTRWQKIQGSLAFVGQYLQSPRAAEGNLFKREWFQFYRELPMERPMRIFDSWDTAFKTKQENDYSVCTTWAEYKTGFYLIDFFMDKIEYPELKQNIQLQHKKKDKVSNIILLEDKASGQSAIQELRRLNLPIKPVMPHADKIVRANQITPTFESGNVYFPFEDYTETIIDQLTGFPNTKHDDIVDSISQALNWAREKTAGMPIIASSSGTKNKKRRVSKYLRGYK